MQFRDLVKQYDTLKPTIEKAILDVAAGGHYIMGPQVQELERRLSAYVGVKHCLTCANGTDALTLALKAWGVGRGDAVFVPDFTFFSSAEVVSLEGATPVFVDVNPETFNIDAVSLESAVKAVIDEGRLRPRVLVAVDLFGLPADFAKVRAVADKYGLLVLEDGAQGFGGSINGRKACSFGDIATTSFFPAKPLGCYGDGGAVFTNNDEWAALIASYRVHGKGSDKYDNVRIGLNSRLDTLQAAILLVKLDAFDDEVEKVNEVARMYNERLNVCGRNAASPVVPDGFRSSWAQYTIRLHSKEERDGVQQALRDAGIPSMVYYPKPMHSQTAFSGVVHVGENDSNMSVGRWALQYQNFNANTLCDTVLSLPMHPYLSENEIDAVCSSMGHRALP